MEDKKVFTHIEELTAAEEALFAKGDITEDEKILLHNMSIELDQCWDLLRQRRALRDAGKNPEDAKMRSPGTVEGYLQ